MLTVVVSVVPVLGAPLGDTDRTALLQDLERSRKAFLAAVADVQTEAQWNYKPAPDRWSVAECAAHIIAAEDYFRQSVAAAMKNPSSGSPPSGPADADIARMIRDRSQRFQAPAGLEPEGRVAPKAQAIAAFEAARGSTLEYVRTTTDALREHSTGAAPNTMSAYQLMLMLSGHTERHT